MSRRSALRGAGLGLGGILGAALVGCGGDDDEPVATSTPSATATSGGGGGGGTATATPTATEEPSFLGSRIPTDAQAQRGGIYQGSTTADVTNLDPLASPSFTANTVGRWTYPQLLQWVPGVGGPGADGSVEPQLAESYEFTDANKLILHLRTDAKWEDRAPTSSRPLDAEDVVFSWKKFAASSISRDSLANEVSPSAPIVDMRAVDDHTIEVDLAFAFAPLLGSLAYTRWLQIMPREADGGFDPRNETRGAGPWVLDSYDRSISFKYRRNPNYWDSNLPYLDGFDVPIVAEYAQRLAQFRAGKIWSGVVAQTDILDTKSELPELNVLQGDFTRGNWYLYFDLRTGSPFLDERVRRAVSMLIDRTQINETFYRTGDFADAGWPTEERWHGVGVSAGYDGFWIDPRGSEYTPEQAAVYAYNPEEAIKLIEAAGHNGAIDTKISWIGTGQYGTTFPRVGEAYVGLLEASGKFKLSQNNPDYQTDYLPNYYFGKGDFEGIAWGATTIFPHPAQHIQSYYHSQGGRQKTALGGDPASVEGTAASDALIEQALAAIDFEEQVELVKRWQKENALRMPIVPAGWPYGVPGYGLNWPWVGNYGAYRNYLEQAEQVEFNRWWIDEAKRKEIQG